MQDSPLTDRDERAAIDAYPEITARPTYFLNAQSYCCELEGGAIILDLITGTYVGVHAEYLPDLRTCIRNWPSHGAGNGVMRTITNGSENLIAALLTRGILTTSPTPKRSSAPPTPTAAMTGDSAFTRSVPPIRHLPQFVMSLLTVSLRHHDKELAELLGWISQRQCLVRRRRHTTPDSVMKLLASFFRLRIWFYTAHRHCLFDSLVLAVFLTRKTVPCTFVIGVSTKPFLAHSWVQIGTLVLNDTAEHVQTFTPILAIGESN
jgi:hypothetical protein